MMGECGMTAAGEMTFRPDVIPAECATGHVSYPAAVRLQRPRIFLNRDQRAGECPDCGTARIVPMGHYMASPDGPRRILMIRGRAHPVTQDAYMRYHCVLDGSEFESDSIEGLSQAMTGISMNNGDSGNSGLSLHTPG
jgi:hypothetical protein